MSAYIQDSKHIAALVRVATKGPTDARYRWEPQWQLREQTPAQVAQMLLDENVKSVSYRYDEPADSDLPGRIDREWTKTLDWDRLIADARDLTIAEAFGAIDGYDYQACEHPDYRTSPAYYFVNDLRAHLASKVTGDGVDTWSITENRAEVEARKRAEAQARLAEARR